MKNTNNKQTIQEKRETDAIQFKNWVKAGVGIGVTSAVLGSGLACFRVARVGEYIVRTGWMVRGSRGIDVFRRGFVLPRIQKMDASVDHSFVAWIFFKVQNVGTFGDTSYFAIKSVCNN